MARKTYVQKADFNFDWVGMVVPHAISAVPTGWLECDGSALNQTTYSDLYTVIGSAYGNGGAGTFNLPDLRGRFLRGWDHGAGNDPDSGTRTDRGDGVVGDWVGTVQVDAFQGHYHSVVRSTWWSTNNDNYDFHTTNTTHIYRVAAWRGTLWDIGNGAPRESTESRPINKNMMYIIKY